MIFMIFNWKRVKSKNNFCCFQNQSREGRCVDVSMETSSVFYTGTKAHLIKRGLGEFDLQPNERNEIWIVMIFNHLD